MKEKSYLVRKNSSMMYINITISRNIITEQNLIFKENWLTILLTNIQQKINGNEDHSDIYNPKLNNL